MSDDDHGNDPLIPAKYAPLIAALFSILTTVVIWSLSQVINLNQRIDILEAKTDSLIDSDGQPVPSKTAIRSEVRLDSLDKGVDEIFRNMDRIWDVLNRMQGL